MGVKAENLDLGSFLEEGKGCSGAGGAGETRPAAMQPRPCDTLPASPQSVGEWDDSSRHTPSRSRARLPRLHQSFHPLTSAKRSGLRFLRPASPATFRFSWCPLRKLSALGASPDRR